MMRANKEVGYGEIERREKDGEEGGQAILERETPSKAGEKERLSSGTVTAEASLERSAEHVLFGICAY